MTSITLTNTESTLLKKFLTLEAEQSTPIIYIHNFVKPGVVCLASLLKEYDLDQEGHSVEGFFEAYQFSSRASREILLNIHDIYF